MGVLRATRVCARGDNTVWSVTVQARKLQEERDGSRTETYKASSDICMTGGKGESF